MTAASSQSFMIQPPWTSPAMFASWGPCGTSGRRSCLPAVGICRRWAAASRSSLRRGSPPVRTTPSNGGRQASRTVRRWLRSAYGSGMAQRQTRFVSDTVSWELWERDAAPVLRPHVVGYCGYREWGSAGFRRLENTVGRGPCRPSFGPRIRCNGEEIESFVAAPDLAHAVVESLGEQHCVEIRLTPLGTHLVLGLPMDELACRTVAFADAWGDQRLIDRLWDAPSWHARFALLDAVLTARLEAAPPAGAGARRSVATARGKRGRRAGRRARARGRAGATVALSPASASRWACRRRRSGACCASRTSRAR